jgi:O-antigen ligase
MESYAPQEMFIQYSSFLFFALSLAYPAKHIINSKSLAVAFGLMLGTTLLMHFQAPAQKTLINCFLGLFIVKTVAERFEFDFKSIGKVMIGFTLLNLVWLFLQFKNIDPIFSSISPENMPQVDMVGFFGGKFAMGVWASLVTPFVFSVHPIFCVLLVPLVVISKSSTAVLAFLLSFFFLLYHRNKQWFFAFVFFAILGAIYYVVFKDMPTGQFEKRLQIWHLGINLMKDKPWFGLGLGQWSSMMIMTTQQTSLELKYWKQMHNDILQLFFEQGVAMMIVLWFYIKNFFRSINLKETYNQYAVALFISLSIASLFHFPFHVGRLAGISLVILGIFEAVRCKNEKISPSPIRTA